MTARVLLSARRIGLAAALALAACSDSAPPSDICADATCPAGQVCQEGACVAAPGTGGTGELGRYTAVALTSDDRRVIATFDATFTNLILRRESPDGSFTAQTIAGWGTDEDGATVDIDHGRWASIAVDIADRVHLAWYDATEDRLTYGRVDADGPALIEIPDGDDNAAARGTHTSLVIADTGEVHIAYRDQTKRRLRHAERALDGTWETVEIDGCAGEAGCPEAAEDYGEYSGIALVGGAPRIAFYDRLRGDLKLAERAADGLWEALTLDGRDPATGVDEGDVGRFAALATDASHRLGIAYYDASRSSLRYLSPGGGGVGPVIVDAGTWQDPITGATRQHPVGQHVGLRFDSQGRATMVYLDAGRLLLKRARVSGATVSGPTDVAGLPAGAFIDFGITAAGGLSGAYGAWVGDGTTRTRLETFELPVMP